MSIAPTQNNILSVDGGGVRGIIPAIILAEIEQRTGKAVCQLFSYLAGSSTGAIVTSALNVRKPGTVPAARTPLYSGKKVVELFKDNAAKVFAKWWQPFQGIWHLFSTAYSPEGLRHLTREFCGDTKLGQTIVHQLIPAFSVQSNKPRIFTSCDPQVNTLRLADLLMAATAAPSDFPAVDLPIDSKTSQFIDAGLAVNNPELLEYADAVKHIGGRCPSLFLLSIGTGVSKKSGISQGVAKHGGELVWASPAIGVAITGNGESTDWAADKLLGNNHCRIQVLIEEGHHELDDASPANMKYLESRAQQWIQHHKEGLDELCRRLLKKN